MQITVKLFANLAAFGGDKDSLPGTPFKMEVEEGLTLGRLAKLLALPEGQVKVSFVNGIIQPPEWILKPGDEVGIFPPIGGGYSHG